MTYYQYYHQELSDGGNLRIYLWGLPMVATYGGYLWWLPLKNPFRRLCLFIVTDFKPFQEVPVMFLIVVKICEYQGPPHGAPMESLQGATFENPFRRPCLFIVTDFKPFLEVPV